jgi:hypothetical protein
MLVPKVAFARDPLVAFFILGGLCFAAYALAIEGKSEIRVSRSVQQQLMDDHELLVGRKPTLAEIDRLVQSYVESEILFFESLQQGMHTGDTKTKQRLVEKMRFLLTDEIDDPDAADLVNFYADHPHFYYTEPKYVFVQRYFSQAPEHPDALRVQLGAGAEVPSDPFWLGEHLQAYDESMVRAVLGQPFIDALKTAQPGAWFGPLQTAKGWHYVKLDSLIAPQIMPFSAIREQVRQDWFEDRRVASVDARLAALKKKYDVVVEH